jgi:hypothetical protein
MSDWLNVINWITIFFMLVGGVILTIVFLKYRIKHILIMLLCAIVLLVIFILDYIYPNALFHFFRSFGLSIGIVNVLRWLICALLILLVIALNYYPQIKQLLIKVIQKRKLQGSRKHMQDDNNSK